MPRARQHLLINAVVLTVAEIYTQTQELKKNPEGTFNFGRLLLHVGAGTFAGALPDLIEPSKGQPNHRGFFHSASAAILVWWLVSGKHTHGFSAEVKRLLMAMGLGYSCHLGADFLFSKAKGMGFFNAKI
jgi:membrane-bound metal-dependent hydrolase YbcI (DUF457 family)